MKYDFGKVFGDDMNDGDLAALDGMGAGGEFQTDTDDVDMAEMEAEENIDEAETVTEFDML